MHIREFFHKMSGAISFIAAAHIVKFIKVSMVIGSYTAFFSLNNCLLPLSGAFFGLTGALFVTLIKMIFGMLAYGGLFPLSKLAFCIPGFFAAAYWTSPSWLLRIGVPLACMLLFIVHPVGGQVWVYAMYWWIPIALYFIQKNNLFMIALGSTFVAHAVGSVIWLYTVPMSTSAWVTLLPVVIIERLIFAAGAVMLYKGIHAIITHLRIPWIAFIRRSA